MLKNIRKKFNCSQESLSKVSQIPVRRIRYLEATPNAITALEAQTFANIFQNSIYEYIDSEELLKISAHFHSNIQHLSSDTIEAIANNQRNNLYGL